MRWHKIFTLLVAASLTFGFLGAAQGEVVTASGQHFVLRHEATSTLTPEQLWQRLIKPASWWHPDHTYSGRAENLTLKAQAGGHWLEAWDGGSVSHGQVLYVKTGQVLRMNAPFGPLQDMGAYTIWTITVSADGPGSKVVFDEVSQGPPESGMAAMAKAVDGVKAEAIRRLTASE